MKTGRSIRYSIDELRINNFVNNHTNYRKIVWDLPWNGKTERLLYSYIYRNGLYRMFRSITNGRL